MRSFFFIVILLVVMGQLDVSVSGLSLKILENQQEGEVQGKICWLGNTHTTSAVDAKSIH